MWHQGGAEGALPDCTVPKRWSTLWAAERRAVQMSRIVGDAASRKELMGKKFSILWVGIEFHGTFGGRSYAERDSDWLWDLREYPCFEGKRDFFVHGAEFLHFWIGTLLWMWLLLQEAVSPFWGQREGDYPYLGKVECPIGRGFLRIKVLCLLSCSLPLDLRLLED